MYELMCLLADGAEGGGALQGPVQQPNPMDMMKTFLIPMVLIFLVMYFLVIRPTNRQRKEQLEMVKRAGKNDKVLTSSGIIGYIVSVKEGEDEVTLKTGDQEPTSRISVQRSSIVRLLSPLPPAAEKKT